MKRKSAQILQKTAPLLMFLLVVGVWMLIWNRIGKSRAESERNARYASFSIDGAYYEECSLSIVQLYDSSISAIDAQCCGSQLTEMKVADKTMTLYHLASLEQAGKRDGILLADDGTKLRCYELTSFESFGDNTMFADLFAAYGITSADDIKSVRISDADGNPLEMYTESAQIRTVFENLSEMGKPLSSAEIAKQYYDVYAAAYGEGGFTEDYLLEGEMLEPKNDAIAKKAAELWGEDMMVANLELKNGLWLNRIIYAPKVGMVTAYNNFRAEKSPFLD